MTDEHMGTCIYEKGRFELRETDNAIIDLKGDFPPIMIASNTVDDGSEPNYADKGSVLHLLNELADTNPNEERHWYLKKMLDKAWKQYHEQKEENKQLKQAYTQLKHRHSLLHDVCIEAECDRDRYCKDVVSLEKENEQLKQSNERLLKMLDIVANYMQKQNKYMPIDDFVEWWNGIATKGLDFE